MAVNLAPQFYAVERWPYQSACEQLVQYGVLVFHQGFIVQGASMPLSLALTNTSAYTLSFLDDAPIQPVDYADQSMLATDIDKSLGLTQAVFVSHARLDPSEPVVATSIDVSVGQYVPGSVKNPAIVINTFSNNVRTPMSISVMMITTGIRKMRT